MKAIILVLGLATLVASQPPDTACLSARLTSQTTCGAELFDDIVTSVANVTSFCASECATVLRGIYDMCYFTGPLNQVETICNGGLISPDAACLTAGLQTQTQCLSILSGTQADPTAFCTSECALGISAVYQGCGFFGFGNPISAICDANNFNFSATNPVCLGARLSTLSNCAIELLTDTATFCSGQCAQSVREAFDDCGFTGLNNPIDPLCAAGPGGIANQDPVCIGLRIQNLQPCLAVFLNNVSTFCDGECHEAFETAFEECGYVDTSNPISLVCNGGIPGLPNNDICVASRLQNLEECTQEIATDPAAFCNSTCYYQVLNSYVDCGYVASDTPPYQLCAAIPVNGPDPLCLAESTAGLDSCVTTFLTYPTTFCSSSCYSELNDAYTQCGYTGPNNPFSFGCQPFPQQDPICLARNLLNTPDCLPTILSNFTEFCSGPCFDQIFDSYENCGFVNESNPANICFLAGPGGNPATAVDICLQTQLPQVTGCLTDFTNNPLSYCTTSCANQTREIYLACGFEDLYGPGSNPVDQICFGDDGSTGPLCLAYGLQSQTECLTVLLVNSTSFCTSDCFNSTYAIYNECGYTGFNNPLTFSCPTSPGIPAVEDPVCLSAKTQEMLPCFAQLLTDRGTFCQGACASTLSNAFTECGYIGYANPVTASCSGPAPDNSTTCVSSSTVYQDCIAEISVNPVSFCTSVCVTDIASLYDTCGIPQIFNPTVSFCTGLPPETPGQPSPICLANGLTNLQGCITEITTDFTNFCTSVCASDLSTAYDECGYPNETNPVSLLCADLPDIDGTGDLTCLTSALTNLQDCVTQLSTDPSSFCGSQCSDDLSNAYVSCGYIVAANPVSIACNSGELPGQDPFCISGKLTDQGLQDCTTKLNTGSQDFCGSECDADLRTAYSECGFTGITNPISVLCSGDNGQPNSICLGAQLQLHQECVSSILGGPASLCGPSPPECAATLQSAYTMCGYHGNDNPFISACAVMGGAEIVHAVPMVAISLLLIVLALIL